MRDGINFSCGVCARGVLLREERSGTSLRRSFAGEPEVRPLQKVKREAAAQRRPARTEWKNALFPRYDRPYGVKCEALQAENAPAEDVAAAGSLCFAWQCHAIILIFFVDKGTNMYIDF